MYVNEAGRIETDLKKYLEKTKILHKVVQDDTSWGFWELWNKLTSWLPNFYWLKQLFIGILILLILVFLTCVLVQCAFWCCVKGLNDYETWKCNQIKHHVETGKNFMKTLNQEGVL